MLVFNIYTNQATLNTYNYTSYKHTLLLHLYLFIIHVIILPRTQPPPSPTVKIPEIPTLSYHAQEPWYARIPNPHFPQTPPNQSISTRVKCIPPIKNFFVDFYIPCVLTWYAYNYEYCCILLVLGSYLLYREYWFVVRC